MPFFSVTYFNCVFMWATHICMVSTQCGDRISCWSSGLCICNECNQKEQLKKIQRKIPCMNENSFGEKAHNTIEHREVCIFSFHEMLLLSKSSCIIFNKYFSVLFSKAFRFFFLEIVRFSFQGDRNSFTYICSQFTPCKLMCLILLSIASLRIIFIVKYHNVKNCKLDILCCLSQYSLCVVNALSGIGKCTENAPI